MEKILFTRARPKTGDIVKTLTKPAKFGEVVDIRMIEQTYKDRLVDVQTVVLNEVEAVGNDYVNYFFDEYRVLFV
jgi:hypothetical protein